MTNEDSDNNKFMHYLAIVIAGMALVVIVAACVVGVVILWKSKNRENGGDEYEGEHSMAALKFSEIEFDTDESISLNNRYKIYPHLITVLHI